MKLDYHMHTKYCNHAFGEMDEYVERAIELGFEEMGFSAHFPWMIQEREKLALSWDEIEIYAERVKELQKTFPQIKIRFAAEMDYHPESVGYIREYIDKYDFDYIIGSVHHIGSWGFDQETQMALFEKYDTLEVYKSYFKLVKELIELNIVDTIGHIDLIKKFGHKPETGYQEIMDDVCESLKKTDTVVEINASGLIRPCKEQYPSFDFLKTLRKYDVKITFGSDSHRPEEVGRYFDEMMDFARSVGYDEICSYEKRKKIMRKI